MDDMNTDNQIDFRHLFESSPALMLVLSTNLYIVAVTDAYLHATMTLRKDIIGKYIFDIFPDNPDLSHADGVNNLHTSLRRVLEYKKPDTMAVQRYDIKRPESEGGGFEKRYWSPLNSPVFSHDNSTLLYIIHRVKDATEFMNLKEQYKTNEDLVKRTELMEVEILTRARDLQYAREILEQKNAELMQSNAEIESFSYSVSHDLRAPLRAVSGYSGILAEEYGNVLDNEGKRLLGEVQKNSKKMGVLIDDLLALSKLGRKEIRLAKIDMPQLTKDALNEINHSDTSKVNISIGPLHEIVADPSLIMHVMTNLLSNAIKYSSHSASPSVAVSSVCNDAEVVYTITDNGVGFDMAYVNKLFGVFQRLHSATEFEGTGVGLAIVKRVIERHGGKVWAEGKLDQVASFYFSIPIIHEIKQDNEFTT